MSSQITYDDKVSLQTSPLPNANKCTADDLNEIKTVVNENATELDAVNTVLSNIIGEVQYPTYTNGSDISSDDKTYYQKIGNRVFVNLNVKASINNQQYLTIFTLPQGYRPAYTVYVPCLRRGYDTLFNLYVNSNGNVAMFSNTSVSNGNFSGEISFAIAEEG